MFQSFKSFLKETFAGAAKIRKTATQRKLRFLPNLDLK